MADFVVSNDIGFTISSLNELPEKMQSLTPADFERFKLNVSLIKKKLEAGDFLQQAVEQAEQAISG